jgi:hypothetical protein
MTATASEKLHADHRLWVEAQSQWKDDLTTGTGS